VKSRNLHIIYYTLKFKWSRTFHSSRVGLLTHLKWKLNLRKSPFYRSLLSKGVRFPVLDKTMFMALFDSINTQKIRKKEAFSLAQKAEESRDFAATIRGISIGLSSGTSGNKGMFLTSRIEQEKWVGAVLDRVIGLSLRKRKVAFFLRANNNLYEAVTSKLIQFNFYDIKKPWPLLIAEFIKSKSTILVAQPSVLLEIARHCERHAIALKLDKIISVAEVLEEDIKIYLANIFKKPIHQVYQCTEGFLAYTCRQGSLHLNEDFLKIDRKYLDEDLTKFHPVITDYLRYTQPVIRYELNDILHLGDTCSCGSKATVIEKIEGRSDDVFRFIQDEIEIVIFPDFVRRAVIRADENISNYIVAQKSNTDLTISIEGDRILNLNNATEALQQMCYERGLMDINISHTPFEHNPILKFKRIRNDSKATI
jgi:putative adenylate-forming enzyme